MEISDKMKNNFSSTAPEITEHSEKILQEKKKEEEGEGEEEEKVYSQRANGTVDSSSKNQSGSNKKVGEDFGSVPN